MEWFEELEFDNNPLTAETKYIGDKNILDEAFYSIISGNMIVIEGKDGKGKTKILREVIKKFGGKGKIAYVNCKKLDKQLNIEDIVTKKNGILGSLFKKQPKNMVLLLDDVEELSERNLERIKYYFDRNYLRAVIIATKDLEALGLNESIEQRIFSTIKLKDLSGYEAVQIFRDKIGDKILTDRALKEVYKLSNNNIKEFLDNCEEICKAHVVDKEKEIKEEDIKAIISQGGEK
jgi:Cdc6-like AAA superfamily ATPase